MRTPLIVAFILATFWITYAAPGDLDQTFGNGGKLVNQMLTGNTRAISMQSDGKFVVAGSWEGDRWDVRVGLVRYNPDGTLDTTFGAAGKVQHPYWFIWNSVAIQSDGKIVVAGLTPAGEQSTNFCVGRYNADGTVDGTFGDNGYSCPSIGGTNYTAAYAVAILPSGNSMTAGDWDQGYFIASADGSIGSAMLDKGARTVSIAIQSDGKIVAVGGNGADFIVVRYTANGLLDTSFGTVGVVRTYEGGSANSVAIQPDGKIIAAGYACPGCPKAGYSGFGLVRLNSDGSLDKTFDADGKVETGISGIDVAYSVAVQPNGKIVAAGTCYGCQNHNFTIVRYQSEGSLDGSFGGDGISLVDFGNSNDESYGMALDLEGRAVVVGDSEGRLAIARVLLGTRETTFDFDGDGKTDIGVTRPNGGIKEWWLSRSSDSNVFSTVFGVESDISAPADFTGDGKTDIAVFRPSTGFWYVLRSEDFSYAAFPFGSNGDIPMPADYDGDGKADPAVFRPSGANWFINRSSDGQTTIAQFGAAGNQPVAADYDGDGKADIAIYRQNNGAQEWWIQRSTAGLFATVFGASGDKAVPGDYTSDGKTDIAVWRPSNGNWFILRSEDLSYLAFPWGANGDLPAPGDYDGDGKTDAAVFRQSSATWFVNRTGGQGPLITNFGANTDSPVAGAFVR